MTQRSPPVQIGSPPSIGREVCADGNRGAKTAIGSKVRAQNPKSMKGRGGNGSQHHRFDEPCPPRLSFIISSGRHETNGGGRLEAAVQLIPSVKRESVRCCVSSRVNGDSPIARRLSPLNAISRFSFETIRFSCRRMKRRDDK